MLGPFVEVFSYLKKSNEKTEKQSAGNASYKFLVFLRHSKNFISIYNSIMKQNNNSGSSETIRKTPRFDFDNFYKYGHADHVPRIDESFLEWFIGFFEGDGCFSIGKDQRFYLTLGQKEKQILSLIYETFGVGSICSDSKKNGELYWQWRVCSKSGLNSFAVLFFNNLVLKKRQTQFLNWLKQGKQNGLFCNFPVFQPKQPKIGLNDAWLSGFIDAEGCFYARVSIKTKHTKNLTVKFYQTFSLKQSTTFLSDQIFFKKILVLFKSSSNVFYFKPKHKNSYLSIQLASKKSHKILIDYLFHYKLKTTKYISFRRWWRIYLLKKKNKQKFVDENLSQKSWTKIQRLAQSINKH